MEISRLRAAAPHFGVQARKDANRYGLPQASHSRLTIYNSIGQEVARLSDEMRSEGFHEATWNATNVASGVYFYRLETKGSDSKPIVMSKKMLLLR